MDMLARQSMMDCPTFKSKIKKQTTEIPIYSYSGNNCKNPFMRGSFWRPYIVLGMSLIPTPKIPKICV